MQAIKAIFENGHVRLEETPTASGPVNVLVVFPDAEDDPWQAILKEKIPRPAFAQFAKKCLAEIAHGKAEPLELDKL